MQADARDIENRKRRTEGATEYVDGGQQKLQAASTVRLGGHDSLSAVECHS
jgi:hypothetical protein